MPTLVPLIDSPFAVQLHVGAAMLAILLLPLTLFRRRRDGLHKAAGYLWVTAMVTAALSSFFITGLQMIGPFQPHPPDLGLRAFRHLASSPRGHRPRYRDPPESHDRPDRGRIGRRGPSQPQPRTAHERSVLRHLRHRGFRDGPYTRRDRPWHPDVTSRTAPGVRGGVALKEESDGAVEKTRTSTGVTPQRPQRCASTNSATTAQSKRKARTV